MSLSKETPKEFELNQRAIEALKPLQELLNGDPKKWSIYANTVFSEAQPAHGLHDILNWQQRLKPVHRVTMELFGTEANMSFLPSHPEDQQFVQLAINDKPFTFPRSTDSHSDGISVSADQIEIKTMNIKLGDYDDPLLDRGLVWLHPTNDIQPARLSFNIVDAQLNENGLISGLRRIADGVKSTLIPYQQEQV